MMRCEWLSLAHIVRLLIERGDDIDYKDPYTLLTLAHLSVLYDDADAFRELAKAGADLNAVDANGKIPIQFAEDVDRYAKFVEAVVGL